MIVLDTHTIIWDALDNKKLSVKAKRAINSADENSALVISDISLWEIAMLIQRRRLEIAEAPARFIELALQSRNYQVQPITGTIAGLSVSLGERINGDPADRLIVATALAVGAPLVTADRNLRGAKIVPTIW
jgi:PIN domain nuclease of toxin-antitoxin system